ncbi:33017_t:CDS:2, partial [Gigaspora margarita]
MTSMHKIKNSMMKDRSHCTGTTSEPRLHKISEMDKIPQTTRKIPRGQKPRWHEVIKTKIIEWADKKRIEDMTVRNKIALRRLEAKKEDWIINKQEIIGKEIAEDKNCIKRCKGYRQKNTKGEKCTIKINKETENYRLVADCKKRLRTEIENIKALIEVKKSRKCTKKSNIEKQIYIPKRKILSAIMNEMDKRRDQKAEFWVKISRRQLDKKEDLGDIK